MDSIAKLSIALDHELAANDRPYIDPRTLPVRCSRLKKFAQSAAHYLEACQEGDDADDSLILRLGSGTHAMLFDKPVTKWDQPAKKGTGKAPRSGEKWEEFQKEHAGEVILNAREWQEAQQYADAIRRNRIARELLFTRTIIEQRIDWTFMGRACRSTPDVRSSKYVVDLKTTVSSDPRRFVWQAFKQHYHAQAAFYLDAIEAATGTMLGEFYLIAVEKSEPHPVTTFRLTDRTIEQGRKSIRLWFEQLLSCEATNQWPEYSESIVDLDVPDMDDEPFELEVDGKAVTF